MRLDLFDALGKKLFQANAEKGQTYAQAIWLSPEVKKRPLCGGLGLCGRCRVRFLKGAPQPVSREKDYFSPEDLVSGWRLACCHQVSDGSEDAEIVLPDSDIYPPPQATLTKTNTHDGFLGIDLGTTTLQWRYVAARGETRAQGSTLNPQMAAGPDVISRLKYACENKPGDHLSDLVMNEIAGIIADLSQNEFIPERICIAGNSVMTHILLKCDISGLASAPYHLDCKGGEAIFLSFCGQSFPCVIPPLPAPFIGGDISSGLAEIIDKDLKRPLILADLGTNAELALLLGDNRLFLASAPLGPAMEGIGPKCGQPAGEGTAVSFSLSPAGLIPEFFNNKRGKFISASGYFSLLSHLLNLNLIDRDGHFTGKTLPVVRHISLVNNNGQASLQIGDGLCLDASDVELLLKVKASFRMALSRLMEVAGAEEINTFILAGAIGEYANIADLINLAFIPASFEKRLILAGNTSLAGACLLAREPWRLESLVKLCETATIIDLANDPVFLQDYLSEMSWQ